jgi:hypothetical protein
LAALLAALLACLRHSHDPTAHPPRASHKQWATRSHTRLSISSTGPLATATATALHRRDKADMAAESSLPCRAHPRHSRTQPRSKCGRIPPSEPPRTQPSRDPKGKRSRRNKARRASSRASNRASNRANNRASSCQHRGKTRQRRHSSRVPATTTGMAARAVLASCLATLNRRRATSRNSRR